MKRHIEIYRDTFMHTKINRLYKRQLIFPDGLVVKNLPAGVGDIGDKCPIPGLPRSSGEGNGNALQYSCLENSMDGGAWRATVHGVAKN